MGDEAGTPTYLSLAVPNVGFTHRRSLRARSPFTRPCRSFCCAYAELIRDQTPPDDFCNCLRRAGNQTQTPAPRRDDGLDHLPFLSASRRSSLSSDTWRAALASASADPGAGSSRLPRFAQPRYLQLRPTTTELPRWCIVRIDEHGSEDRAKDASRFACDGVPCLRPVPTLGLRRPTSFPSSATSRTSAVTGALSTRGGSR